MHAEDNDPTSESDLVSVSDILPPVLPLLPTASVSLFPGIVVPFIVPEGELQKVISHAMENQGYVGMVLNRGKAENKLVLGPNTSMTGLPAESDPHSKHSWLSDKHGGYYRFGVAGKIVKRINLPDNQISILISGLQRIRLESLASAKPFTSAKVTYLYETSEKSAETEALLRSSVTMFKQISKENPLISEEVKVAVVNIDSPGKLADFMASILIRDAETYLQLIAASEVKDRLSHLVVMLQKEIDLQTVQRKIQDDVTRKLSNHQREFYLHEQLRSIQRELGQLGDDRKSIEEKYKQRLEGKVIPEEVKKCLDEEMEKLGNLHDQSAEYSVVLNYLDWITSFPWGVRSKEYHDLNRAKRVLEEGHYGLKDVKERILEFLAVRKLKNNSEGSILCFVGPPGTGKTSLGRAVAKTLGRKFYRFSVGGMRDEAEIKGHRRTYVGAMPGKIVQGFKRSGTQNPVFLIDEIDKIATHWTAGGDPASALLELLDPEQNSEFMDHYMDVPINCSEVLFITTANSTDSIPAALLDRMEVISLYGYTDTEKLWIARRHLLGRLRKKHALRADQLDIQDKALRYILSHYARESGVRNLEKCLSRICRKTALKIASGRSKGIVLKDKLSVEKLLGTPPFIPEAVPSGKVPGVAVGLAWTQHGGEVLTVESLAVPGRGGLVLTGTLGKVMQESANIAYTYIRERAREVPLPHSFFDKNVLHLHVPAGATPKDGPSAGVTIAASLFSLVKKRPLRPTVAMTGELTLTGRVLPVGGLKEKLLAAKRSAFKTILIPQANQRDLKDIETEVKQGLKIIGVSSMDECFRHIF